MNSKVSLVMILAMLFIVLSNKLLVDQKADLTRINQTEYSEKFRQAVKDTSSYLRQLEGQQEVSSIRYYREKNLFVNESDLLRSYIEDLTVKFQVEGDPSGIQNILMHIPASVIIKYSGYQLVTMTDKLTSDGDHYFSPSIWPLKPYSYKLPNGLVLFFNLDNNLTLYDPSTNQYLRGNYEDLRVARDLSPLTSAEKFESQKKISIAKSIEKDLSKAVSEHSHMVKKIDLQVDFFLPRELDNLTVDNTGFLSFMQGYPLPGGSLLNTYSFSSGTVSVASKYLGVIRVDGRHMAYPEDEPLPEGSTIIEILASEEEAASKGYHIYYKD
jgi:hypothetical protein